MLYATRSNTQGMASSVYVIRGKVNADGVATWSTPLLLGESTSSHSRFIVGSIAGSPNGNVIVTWSGKNNCLSDSYEKPPALCTFLMFSRYENTTGTWSAPEQLTDFPDLFGFSQVHEPAIDDAGNIAIHHLYWEPKEGSDKGEIVERRAISYRPAGHTQWQRHIFKNINVADRSVFSMDNSGNMIWASSAKQKTGRVNVMVSRGTFDGGFEDVRIMDSRQSGGSLSAAHINKGYAAVQWVQTIGSSDIRFVAVADAGNEWQVSDIGRAWFDGSANNTAGFIENTAKVFPLVVGDGGRVYAYNLMPGGEFADASSDKCYVYVKDGVGGQWSQQELPKGVPCLGKWSGFFINTFNRNGDLLTISGEGRWSVYSAATNKIIRSFSGPSLNGRNGFDPVQVLPRMVAAYNNNGEAALVVSSAYEQLPTETSGGILRNGYYNLWGFIR